MNITLRLGTSITFLILAFPVKFLLTLFTCIRFRSLCTFITHLVFFFSVKGLLARFAQVLLLVLTARKTCGKGWFHSLSTIAFRKTIPTCLVIGGNRFSALGATHFENRVVFLNQFFNMSLILCHTTIR